jgi:hypothetical protein
LLNRRRLPFVLIGVCLLLASGAAAAEGDAFTATGTPSHVKPSASDTYTITLTSAAASPSRAQRATITIPPGFSVAGPIQATTQAMGGCEASTWNLDGAVTTEINLRRPGNNDTGLCPGAALTVAFTATSAATEATYTWTTQLFAGDTEPFALNGTQPTVVVDGTPPETTIDSAHPALTKSTSASFAFSSNEAGAFECRLDGAAFSSCTSPISYTGLGEGGHTFAVRATDAAGNTDQTPASDDWTVDTTPPNTTITGALPPTPTSKTSATFAFISSEVGSTFECSRDGEAFTTCTSPQMYDGLPGGNRTFAVRATDPAGNTDTTPAGHSWRIDLVGAATTILTAPPSSTNSTSASFTFESSESGTTFECSLDGVLFTACTSPIGYAGLADGAHTFDVRAVDAAQNTGPQASHRWTIDTRPPRATVTSGPPALGNNRSATFTFAADEAASFQCSLDGGSFTPCGFSASYTGLGDGSHTFVARPTDAVGNTGAPASYGWTIDATAPETTLGSRPRPRTTSLSATFAFSASEAATFQCKLDGGAFAACTSPKRYARLRSTSHAFSVRALDAAGNVDPSPATHRWTIAAARQRAKATSALFAPAADARVTSPPLLRWRRVARASYYNVQIYRGRVKVLSAWPTRAQLRLRARWTYLGRERRLVPGKYRWLVWPRIGRGAQGRYGSALGQSTFTVVPRRR